MKSTFLYLIIILLGTSCKTSAQTLENCNRDCRIKSFAGKLPVNFCMPKGYWVTQIIDTVDLTNDSRTDFIIRWRKKQPSEGDTVRITIFPQNVDGSFSSDIMLNNLYTPIFTDYTKEQKTGNLTLDSVYRKFTYSNYNLVEFKNNTIIVGFFTDAGGGVDFYFGYRKDLKDWVLDKKLYWNQVNKITGKEITEERNAKEQISIKEFSIIDFLD